MKTLKVKYLTPIIFLIFFMPFLRMCEGGKETGFSPSPQNTTVKKEHDVNLNAYQLASLVFDASTKQDEETDRNFLPSLGFMLIVVLSLVMMVMAWRGRMKWVKSLALVNILLMGASLLLYLQSGFIEDWSDLKFGVVVFFLYSVLLFYQSDQEEKYARFSDYE